MFESDTVLKPTATPHDRAIEQAIRKGEPDLAPLLKLMDPDTCPEHLLPWLAWAFSVDVWDVRWPLEYRRRVVKEAIPLHREKGTRAGCKRALAALGIEADIEEWFEYGGRPYTFRVVAKPTLDLIGDPTLPFLNLELRDQVTRVLEWVKPVRAHFDLAFLLAFTGAMPVAAGATARHRVDRAVTPAVVATGEVLRSWLCGFRATHRQKIELEAE